jgi:hypothetical protein
MRNRRRDLRGRRTDRRKRKNISGKNFMRRKEELDKR